MSQIRIRSSADLYFAFSDDDMLGVRFFRGDYFFSLLTLRRQNEKEAKPIIRCLLTNDEIALGKGELSTRINDYFDKGIFQRKIQSLHGVDYCFSCPNDITYSYFEKFKVGKQNLKALVFSKNADKEPYRHIVMAFSGCELNETKENEEGKSENTRILHALPGEAKIFIFAYPRKEKEKEPFDKMGEEPRFAYNRADFYANNLLQKTSENIGLYDVVHSGLELIYTSFNEKYGLIPDFRQTSPNDSVTLEAIKALVLLKDKAFAKKLRDSMGSENQSSFEKALATLFISDKDDILKNKEIIRDAMKWANESIVLSSLGFSPDDYQILFGEMPAEVLLQGSCKNSVNYIKLCELLTVFCKNEGLELCDFGFVEDSYLKCREMFSNNFLKDRVLCSNFPNRASKVSPRTIVAVCPRCFFKGYLLKGTQGRYLCPKCLSKGDYSLGFDPSERYIMPRPYLTLDREISNKEISELCATSFCKGDEKGIIGASLDVQCVIKILETRKKL